MHLQPLATPGDDDNEDISVIVRVRVTVWVRLKFRAHLNPTPNPINQVTKVHHGLSTIPRMTEALFSAALSNLNSELLAIGRPDTSALGRRLPCPWSLHKLKLRCVPFVYNPNSNPNPDPKP